MTVVYSIIANTTPADVIKDVAPQADEPHVLSGPDKFLNTDLEKILKDKGINDRHRRRHLVQWRGALHCEWRCVPRHECDHSG